MIGDKPKHDSGDTNSGRNPQRTFIDVIRKGGKRRGYITVRRRDDCRMEVGYSLCELKDRFNGTLGLEIAFKRGERWLSREHVLISTLAYGMDDARFVNIPHTFVSRLLGDVKRAVERLNGTDAVLPGWIIELQTQRESTHHVVGNHDLNTQPLGRKESAEHA